MKNRIKTDNELANMRISGRILAQVLQLVARTASAGMTTGELDDMAREEVKRLGGRPAFLGYQGFPRVMCISVNEEVQHTIPGRRVLADGDIVNLDFGVNYNGMITDAGVTIGIGEISDDAKRLLTTTKEALAEGIAVVKDGVRTGDIGAVIEARLRRDRLGIVRELAGHGVGHDLHEDPTIENYGKAGKGAVLKAGMTVAIEPIATLGQPAIWLLDDDWTIVTRDGSWAAQFEHTILVTENGAEILTLPE